MYVVKHLDNVSQKNCVCLYYYLNLSNMHVPEDSPVKANSSIRLPVVLVALLPMLMPIVKHTWRVNSRRRISEF